MKENREKTLALRRLMTGSIEMKDSEHLNIQEIMALEWAKIKQEIELDNNSSYSTDSGVSKKPATHSSFFLLTPHKTVELLNRAATLYFFFLGTTFSAVDKVPRILSLPGGSPDFKR